MMPSTNSMKSTSFWSNFVSCSTNRMYMNTIDTNEYSTLHKFIISHTDTSFVVCCRIEWKQIKKRKQKNCQINNGSYSFIHTHTHSSYYSALDKCLHDLDKLFCFASNQYDHIIVMVHSHFSLRISPADPTSIWRNWRECPSKKWTKINWCSPDPPYST